MQWQFNLEYQVAWCSMITNYVWETLKIVAKPVLKDYTSIGTHNKTAEILMSTFCCLTFIFSQTNWITIWVMIFFS